MKKLLILLLFVSCNDEVHLSDTEFVDDILVVKATQIPLSGILIETFANGQISSKLNYKKGKPDGHWKTFDHDGDVVQQGEYIVDHDLENYIRKFDSVKSISVCLSEEGEYNWLELSIDVKQVDISGFSKIRDFSNEFISSKYQTDEILVSFYKNGKQLKLPLTE